MIHGYEKKTKRVIVFLLILSVILSCFPAPIVEAAKIKAAGWEEAYASFLSNEEYRSAGQEYGYDYEIYGYLYDIVRMVCRN